MTNTEALTLFAHLLHGVAPEVDVAEVDQNVPFQDECDLDSMDFLNLITALQRRPVSTFRNGTTPVSRPSPASSHTSHNTRPTDHAHDVLRITRHGRTRNAVRPLRSAGHSWCAHRDARGTHVCQLREQQEAATDTDPQPGLGLLRENRRQGGLRHHGKRYCRPLHPARWDTHRGVGVLPAAQSMRSQADRPYAPSA